MTTLGGFQIQEVIAWIRSVLGEMEQAKGPLSIEGRNSEGKRVKLTLKDPRLSARLINEVYFEWRSQVVLSGELDLAESIISKEMRAGLRYLQLRAQQEGI